MKSITIEYEVTTLEDELVNCFTWSELVKYFNQFKPSTIRKAIQRGTTITGLLISKVAYNPLEV